MTTALVVGFALVAVAALTLAWQSRRSATRRVEALLDELDEPAGEAELEPALTRLERAVERVSARSEGLRTECARLGAALGSIPTGVVVCDEAGRELFRNGPAAAFVGARHGEALVESAVRELLGAAVHGTSARRDLDLFGPPRRTLAVSAVPLDDGSRTIGALAMVEDASERRRLDAVRRDFVANISHELKTPVGALGLLSETIAATDDPEIKQRFADRMTEEAHRMGRIIDDLLDLSRIEADESPVREPVSVAEVVAEAAERVRPLAASRGITISLEVPRRHGWLGDRRQLVSAVANLLENASKYSDDGSTVEGRSRLDGLWVELDVVDHGIGIPARDLERVFERFYRVDRARSRQTGGTGLGLSIVRHIAGNHNGDVRVSSREGEGSVFTLRIPAVPVSAVVADAGRLSAVAG